MISENFKLKNENIEKIFRDKILSLYLWHKIKTMPTLFTIFGLCFFFYSEEHLPIHIHIQNGDGRAKFNVEPEIELVENNGLKSKDLKRAKEIVEMYREEIIAEWKKYYGE